MAVDGVTEPIAPAQEPRFSRRVQITDHDTVFSVAQSAEKAAGNFTRKTVDDMQELSRAEFEASMGMLLDKMAVLCEARDGAMEAAVNRGIQAGLRAAMKDKELITDFWRDGFDELSKHTGNGASQWVGKRILMAVIAAVFVWALTWLVTNGKLK